MRTPLVSAVSLGSAIPRLAHTQSPELFEILAELLHLVCLPPISSLKAPSFLRFQATWMLWNLSSLMGSSKVIILELGWIFVVLRVGVIFSPASQHSSAVSAPLELYALPRLVYMFLGAGTMSSYWCTLSAWHEVGITKCLWKEMGSAAGSWVTSEAPGVVGKGRVLQEGPRPL